MNKTLNKITTRAKQLRKKNPKLKYTDAVKKASLELRKEGVIGGVIKKIPSRKTPIKKPVKRKREVAPKRKVITKISSRKEVIGGVIHAPTFNRIRNEIERAIKSYNDNIVNLRKHKEKGYQVKIKLNQSKLAILKKQLTEQNKLIRLMLK